MNAHKVKYLEMRLKGLSHGAAFALVQALLGPLSPTQRQTLLDWVEAREARLDKTPTVTASHVS